MTQQERDRLVALKKAKKKLITQRAASEEIGVTERQVRRLLSRMKEEGDKVVVHKLRGQESNRKLAAGTRQEIVKILSGDVYRGFGPTLASEYLDKKHGIEIGRETLRKIMTEAGLWRAKRRKAAKHHAWRERRARFGELVQWDTSDHDWLEGRGEKIYLIHMIDDASSRLVARFVRSDSTEENMKVLRIWLERYGRPLAFYTDKDSMFHNAPKRVDGAEPKDMPPTQIGRALQELQIAGLRAHSPQAKGRVERSFQTAQDRLVKGMRVAGVSTLEAANEHLDREFLPWWDNSCTVIAAHPDDAHRPVEKSQDLAAVLSLVQERKVMNDHTFQISGSKYRIDTRDILPGLRGSTVRVELRLDGTMAIAFQGRYLRFSLCPSVEKLHPAAQPENRRSAETPHSQRLDGQLRIEERTAVLERALTIAALPTLNKERRANPARRSSRLIAQDLRSETSPKKCGSTSFLLDDCAGKSRHERWTFPSWERLWRHKPGHLTRVRF